MVAVLAVLTVGVTCLAPTAAALQDEQQSAAGYTERLAGTTVTFEMVPVPGIDGIPRFWITATEVPWDVYDVYVFGLDESAATPDADAVIKPSKPYVLPGDSFGHAGFPALGMTPRAAEHFVEWLSAKTGHPYRLLTEAEWEHACGLATASAAALDDDMAWHKGNADGRTHPVGKKPDSTNAPLPISDMLGNAAEWVQTNDGQYVVKGGSYRDEPTAVTCEARRVQTKAWNMTDPQLPKSPWWLSDAPFVTLRIARSG